MEKQKILKPNGKIVVISDYREKEVSEILLKGFDIILKKMNLEVGDFICSERVAIERKTHSDFVSSIIDGRIFEQAKKLKESFEIPLIMVEGYSNRDINDNALKAAISSLLTRGISIINTRNPSDSAKMIYWIAKKEQEEGKFFPSFKVGKKPKELKTIQESIISSFPGISHVLAKRLLENFGSIGKIINASEEELKKIKGIGNRLAKNIKKIINSEYKSD